MDNSLLSREVEAGGKDYITFDQVHRCLHFRVERHVADDASNIPCLSEKLAKPYDAPNHGAFGNIWGELHYIAELFSLCPVVHQLRHRPPSVDFQVFERGDGQTTLFLHDCQGVHYSLHALFRLQEFFRNFLAVFSGLLLANKSGQERCTLLWLELLQNVLEDKLCEDKGVACVDLACRSTLELYDVVLADVIESLEHLHALEVIGEELQALVAGCPREPLDARL
mmetsp:Transcript_5890/g.17696  ORF Transcript_5890/g.17696 Transcript_5890/m.17696 type:complete len:225 (-) Transcript_5890:2919-3593(-)